VGGASGHVAVGGLAAATAACDPQKHHFSVTPAAVIAERHRA